jgi:hypothetical protein
VLRNDCPRSIDAFCATGFRAARRPTAETERERAHILPRFLPDGDHFVYSSGTGSSFVIYADSLRAPGRRLLVTVHSDTSFVPSLEYVDGFLLYSKRASTLAAHRFDADRLALIGDSITLVENVEEFAAAGRTLAYVEPGSSLRLTNNSRRLFGSTAAGNGWAKSKRQPGIACRSSRRTDTTSR